MEMEFEAMPEFPKVESVQFPIEESAPLVPIPVVYRAQGVATKKVVDKNLLRSASIHSLARSRAEKSGCAFAPTSIAGSLKN